MPPGQGLAQGQRQGLAQGQRVRQALVPRIGGGDDDGGGAGGGGGGDDGGDDGGGGGVDNGGKGGGGRGKLLWFTLGVLVMMGRYDKIHVFSVPPP